MEDLFPLSHPLPGSSDLAIPVASAAAGNRNKGDPSSVWSSLFLRIDSLLLSKCIDEGQAAALRRLAWSRDVSAAEVFADKRECSDKELSGHLLRVLDGSNRWVQALTVPGRAVKDIVRRVKTPAEGPGWEQQVGAVIRKGAGTNTCARQSSAVHGAVCYLSNAEQTKCDGIHFP